jgi:hypothetical protein
MPRHCIRPQASTLEPPTLAALQVTWCWQAASHGQLSLCTAQALYPDPASARHLKLLPGQPQWLPLSAPQAAHRQLMHSSALHQTQAASQFWVAQTALQVLGAALPRQYRQLRNCSGTAPDCVSTLPLSVYTRQLYAPHQGYTLVRCPGNPTGRPGRQHQATYPSLRIGTLPSSSPALGGFSIRHQATYKHATFESTPGGPSAWRQAATRGSSRTATRHCTRLAPASPPGPRRASAGYYLGAAALPSLPAVSPADHRTVPDLPSATLAARAQTASVG